MLIFTECTFRVMIALGQPARQDAMRRRADRTPMQCVVQPGDGRYFPARISASGPPDGRAAEAVARVGLLAGEAEAFFAAGQSFIVWADAIVGDQAIRGEGLLGDGVILSPEPHASPADRDHQARRPAERQPPRATAARQPLLGASPAGGRP